MRKKDKIVFACLFVSFMALNLFLLPDWRVYSIFNDDSYRALDKQVPAEDALYQVAKTTFIKYKKNNDPRIFFTHDPQVDGGFSRSGWFGDSAIVLQESATAKVKYTLDEMKVITAHEAGHIVHRDAVFPHQKDHEFKADEVSAAVVGCKSTIAFLRKYNHPEDDDSTDDAHPSSQDRIKYLSNGTCKSNMIFRKTSFFHFW
jgi:Zn-dependent protease with chaperone function